MSSQDNSLLLTSDSDSDSEEYIVEAIRSWRFNLREDRHEYLIKWKNYDEEDNTWEPREHLTNCPHKLEEFEKSMDKHERKLYRSKKPQSLTGFQRRAEYLGSIGADGPHESDTDEDSKKPDKQKFYCLLRFDDSDYAEEITVSEFYKHRPNDALKFFEQRLLKREKRKN